VHSELRCLQEERGRSGPADQLEPSGPRATLPPSTPCAAQEVLLSQSLKQYAMCPVIDFCNHLTASKVGRHSSAQLIKCCSAVQLGGAA